LVNTNSQNSIPPISNGSEPSECRSCPNTLQVDNGVHLI